MQEVTGEWDGDEEKEGGFSYCLKIGEFNFHIDSMSCFHSVSLYASMKEGR